MHPQPERAAICVHSLVSVSPKCLCGSRLVTPCFVAPDLPVPDALPGHMWEQLWPSEWRAAR